ncbi:MAG TPA: thiamine phosphate synthase [Polyangiaceae bacterium]
MRGLYAIIDSDFLERRGVPLVPFAERVLAGRPAIVQLRAKHASARKTLEWLRELRPLCTSAGARLFANDRPDLAILSHCDGVHVGQGDLPPHAVRQFSRDLSIGVSTHDEAELEEALAEHPAYVAYGPVFATTSKERPDPVVGLARLEAAAGIARAAGVPLVAIGGIDVNRARDVARFAALGAVISALLPESGQGGVTERARELGLRLGGP